MRLACNSLGKKCLTCSGRAYKKSTLWKSRTYSRILAGIVEEVNHFNKGFLGLIFTGNVLECDTGFFLDINLGIALSDI